MLAGMAGELAFEQVIEHGFPVGDLFKHLAQTGNRSQLGQGFADDLFRLEIEEGGLTIVEAQIVKVVEVKESEANRGSLVEGLDLGAFAFGLALEPQKRFSEGLLFVDVVGHAEPLHDSASFIPHGQTMQVPPAGFTV